MDDDATSAKTDRILALKTATEALAIERAEIESFADSSLSLMPEGLLESLTAEQARDLIAYLKHKSQVPMPANSQTTAN